MKIPAGLAPECFGLKSWSKKHGGFWPLLTPDWRLWSVFAMVVTIVISFSLFFSHFACFWRLQPRSSFLLFLLMLQFTYQRGNSSSLDSGKSFEKRFAILRCLNMKNQKTEMILDFMLLTLNLFTFNTFLLIYFNQFYIQLSMELKLNCLGLLIRSSPFSDQKSSEIYPCNHSFNRMQLEHKYISRGARLDSIVF